MEHTQQAGQNPLGFEPIGALLRRFAIPSIIAMLVSALYNLVDQIFIGQGVGMLGNAATNVAFPLTTVCIATALLIGTGGAANFSLALGAGNGKKAAHIAGNAISWMILCGVAIMIIVRLFLRPLIVAFGATQEVLPYALSYTGITSFGIPFLILSSGVANLIRADGSPQYSMACMMVGAVINTILDPVFIFGLHMGVAGAALATVIGQAVSGLIVLRYALHFKTIRLTRKDVCPSPRLLGSIAALGMAGCFNQLAMLVVQIALNNTLTYFGAHSIYGAEIPLACAGIIIKVNMISFSFVLGIAQASQPIVGFNYGAKRYDRVRQTYKLSAVAVTAISCIAFICFQFFPRQIISAFGSGTEEYYLFAERFFRIFLFFTFVNGIQPVTSNFFTSIGKAFRGVILSMTRQILFLLPLILLLPRLLGGVDGVMYAGPVADFAAFVLTVAMVLYEMKTLRGQELDSGATPEKGEYYRANDI